MYKNGFKRIIDFTLVLFVLFVIWPFLLIMGIWLHFANKGAGSVVMRKTKDGMSYFGNPAKMMKIQ